PTRRSDNTHAPTSHASTSQGNADGKRSASQRRNDAGASSMLSERSSASSGATVCMVTSLADTCAVLAFVLRVNDAACACVLGGWVELSHSNVPTGHASINSRPAQLAA